VLGVAYGRFSGTVGVRLVVGCGLSATRKQASFQNGYFDVLRRAGTSKRDEEREFYLRLAARERWSFRELQRQLNGALFERTVLSPPKLSTPLAQ
jgi:hypothetical protein